MDEVPYVFDEDEYRRSKAPWIGGGLALLLVVGMSIAALPVSYVNGVVSGTISSRLASMAACHATISNPKVTLSGGRLLPQLLQRRLAKVQLSVPDLSAGKLKHAAVSVTMRNVRQEGANAVRADKVDAAVTLGFANLPLQTDAARLSFSRAADGSLAVGVTPVGKGPDSTKAKLLAKLDLRGETVTMVPKQLTVFGMPIPPDKLAAQAGAARTQKLPKLPAGVAYRSIVPKANGLHVSLGGVSTTPFSTLPTSAGGQKLTYQAKDGMLAISTTKSIPIIGSIPITIYLAPRLDPGALNLVPKAVEVLGSKRSPDDSIAKFVLSKIDQSMLGRKLPDLPTGVQYKSVQVDTAGIKVTIDGVTVQPFSSLPAQVNGRAATYGVQGELLSVTINGTTPEQANPINLIASPRIVNSVLDLAPQRIEVLGVSLPAQELLSKFGNFKTGYPLAALPGNLAYQGVEIQPNGLRIALTGSDVALSGKTGSSGSSRSGRQNGGCRRPSA